MSVRPSATSPPPTDGLALARRVLETEAAAILGLVSHARPSLRTGRRAAARLPRPGHRHRHRQVGDHLPQDRGDARQHRDAGVLPPPRRSRARRSRRDPRRGRRHRPLAQRRDARSAARDRGDQADRGDAGGADRACRVDAGPDRGRRPRYPRRRGGLPAEPGAHGQHDRGARPRRRAGDDAAGAARLPRGGFRAPAPARLARQGPDAGARPDARRRRHAAGRAGGARCATSSPR